MHWTFCRKNLYGQRKLNLRFPRSQSNRSVSHVLRLLWQPLTRALLIDDDRPRAKVLSHSGENCHFFYRSPMSRSSSKQAREIDGSVINRVMCAQYKNRVQGTHSVFSLDDLIRSIFHLINKHMVLAERPHFLEPGRPQPKKAIHKMSSLFKLLCVQRRSATITIMPPHYSLFIGKNEFRINNGRLLNRIFIQIAAHIVVPFFSRFVPPVNWLSTRDIERTREGVMRPWKRHVV